MDIQMKKANGVDNPSFESSKENLEVNNLGKTTDNDKEDHDASSRAKWGHGLEFLMSCIAMSVGLGNIWRFPFTAYENGGGAFLIPYIIVLILIGRPLYYLEMILGQFTNKGSVKVYEAISPALKGIGYGQIIGSACVATYYCSLMAITLFYLINSFRSQLPWTYCRDEWADYLKKSNKTCVAAANANNLTIGTKTMSSSELYFSQEVLREKTDISDGIGVPDWRLSLCLLASWAVTFAVSRRGVQSSGKASYFLAIFPYVIMITLLLRASTLEGAKEGMYYFIKTDWSKLVEAEVWYAAVTQCFFSLNVGFGSIIMYSSFNDFRHNINRDALVVTTLDTLTSLLSGVTIFGILGNLAFELGVSPDEVISSGGTGLAFISYPDAIAKFQAVPWLFAILFFFMLFVLGIGSLVALQSSVNTAIKDAFPKLADWKISLGTATTGFLVGFIYMTPGGQFMLNLVDHFGGTFVIFLFAILEAVFINWYYGVDNLAIDTEYMLKQKLGLYWKATWLFFMPVMLIAIFVYFIIKLERLTYGKYGYPDEILAVGWCILGVSILQFFYWIFHYLIANKSLGWTMTIKEAFSSKDWGPNDPFQREHWKKFREEKLLESSIKGGSLFRRKTYVIMGK